MATAKGATSDNCQKLAIDQAADGTSIYRGMRLKKGLKMPPLASTHSRGRNQFPQPIADRAHLTTKVKERHTACASKKPKKRQKANNTLTAEQVVNFKSAVEHADRIGLPLNRMLTINWERGGIDDLVAATGQLLKLMSDWLRSNGAQLAYGWTQESGPIVGRHVHLLLHVPPPLVRAMSLRQRGWLKTCGAKYRKGMIKTSRIGASYKASFSKGPSRQAYLVNLMTVVDYVLKDVTPDVRRRMGIKTKGDCGQVRGKRSGVSQNVGKAACLKHAACRQHKAKS